MDKEELREHTKRILMFGIVIGLILGTILGIVIGGINDYNNIKGNIMMFDDEDIWVDIGSDFKCYTNISCEIMYQRNKIKHTTFALNGDYN